MNSKSLLNIINVIIKNEEKFEESPNEIYSLFKKHGYEGDIETLKLDLKNLLNDVIKSDEELSKVAGGKVSKLAAGAVAALTCFPMNSFASGTANTNQNKHSTVNKITDTIKSGAKKVGDATKEYVIEPAKDAAKTIARNPGRSVTVTGALVAYGLLTGLAGKKLASPPKVDTQGVTKEERDIVENASKVLNELAEKYCVLLDEEKKEYSWDLDKLGETPEGLSGKIIIGKLVEEKLMPEKIGSEKPTTAYTQIRNAYIAYEKTQLAMLKQRDKTAAELEKEKKDLQEELRIAQEELAEQKKNIDEQKQEYDEKLKDKDEETKKLKEQHEKNEKELLEAKTDEIKKLKEKYEQNEKQLKEQNEKQLKEQNEKLLKEKDEETTRLKDQHKTEKEKLEQQITALTGKNSQQHTEYAELKKQYNNLTRKAGAIKAGDTIMPILAGGDRIKLDVVSCLRKTEVDKFFNQMKQIVDKGSTQPYNMFREESNKLRGNKEREFIPGTLNEYNGNFSLAEILLKPTAGFPKRLKNKTKLEKVDIGYFNLNTKEYSTYGALRKAARETKTWLQWLKPSSPRFWGSRYGLDNDLVVVQLPELILAACTLKSPKTLVSLLTALKDHLAVNDSSEFRGKVNAALEKVGMRFDAQTCTLVSTT